MRGPNQWKLNPVDEIGLSSVVYYLSVICRHDELPTVRRISRKILYTPLFVFLSSHTTGNSACLHHRRIVIYLVTPVAEFKRIAYYFVHTIVMLEIGTT